MRAFGSNEAILMAQVNQLEALLPGPNTRTPEKR